MASMWHSQEYNRFALNLLQLFFYFSLLNLLKHPCPALSFCKVSMIYFMTNPPNHLYKDSCWSALRSVWLRTQICPICLFFQNSLMNKLVHHHFPINMTQKPQKWWFLHHFFLYFSQLQRLHGLHGLNPPSSWPQEVEYRAPRCKMVSDVDVEEKTWRESCGAQWWERRERWDETCGTESLVMTHITIRTLPLMVDFSIERGGFP